MSSTSTKGSATPSTRFGSASSPLRMPSWKMPSLKFCANHEQRTIVHSAPEARTGVLGALRLLLAAARPAHVLLDSHAGRIAGVLDWGDACVGAPTLTWP